MTEPYHEQLGIARPSLADAKRQPDANAFSLMIVALVEHGSPMSLEEVAERFSAAGIAPAEHALLSLKRCRPGRPPMHRDGDLYELDIHDDDLDLWLFRLGLRGPMIPSLDIVRRPPAEMPGPDVPLSMDEVAEAFRDQSLWSWSAQRLAIAVLDAAGENMPGTAVVENLNRLAASHTLRAEIAGYWRSGAISLEADGTWRLDAGHAVVRSARAAVRALLEARRRPNPYRPDPAVEAARRKRVDEIHAAKRAQFESLRRVLVHAYPKEQPVAAVTVDLATRDLRAWTGVELDGLRSYLAGFDFIAALDVRPLLRTLDFDAGQRHLAELGPPQKTMTVGRSGRSLKITLELVLRGSCGITRSLGDPKKLRAHAQEGRIPQLIKILEAEAKSLHALYQYGKLHGGYRVRWGFIDEGLRVPWKYRDEAWLGDLKKAAMESGRQLEVVAGAAPSWNDPWGRAISCHVIQGDHVWDLFLVDERGYVVEQEDVQLARLSERR